MKAKALLTAVLLAATNFAWAQGGLSIDTAQATDYEARDNNRPEIVVQGPLDNFNAEARKFIVDTDKLKQDYNGQA